MKWIVGLGNPGRKYENTPHNVGYAVADELAARAGLKWFQARKIEAAFAEGTLAGAECMLLKPTAFMNLSGDVLAPLVRGENIRIEADLLLVLDDVDLPLGRLRIRPSGSHGGHRGLESVIHRLGSRAFPRLRCGVGPEQGNREQIPAEELSDYVLAKWPRALRPKVEEMIARAADAAEQWVTGDLGEVMTAYNRK